MDNGYFKVWRKIIESNVFKNEGLLKVWIWCLAKASYKERIVKFLTGRGGIEVPVGPGQFIFGRDSASTELDMNPSTVWKRIAKLKNLKNLTIESNRQYSIITIVNWNTYQEEIFESNSESNKQVTGKEQASNTNNKDKKVNKENNKTLYGKFVRLTDDEHKKLVDRFGQSGAEKWIETLNEGIELKGYKYTSHYLAVLKWERNEKERSKPLTSDPFDWIEKEAVN